MSERTEYKPEALLDTSRRQIALGLLGALGGTAFLKGCAAHPASGSEQAEPDDQLGAAIQAATDPTAVRWFETIAGSAGRPGLSNAAGTHNEVAVVLGYHKQGDGGGGLFFYSDTPASEDGGTIFNPSASPPASAPGWRRLYSGALNVRWFGASGNGDADDTEAIHAALRRGGELGAAIEFPPGVYRATTGYQQNVADADVILRGPGRVTESGNLSQNFAVILYDPQEPADGSPSKDPFMDLRAPCVLRCDGLIFSSVNTEKDQPFFAFSGRPQAHFLTDCCFEKVPKPLVYRVGSYFQSSALRDVQFRNSGTIHSDTAELVGTFLRLDNVNHEADCPDNSEKVVCDLRGVRRIVADCFLLEGHLPGAGWTVLRLHSPDAGWLRQSFATIRSFHSEWTQIKPTYTVDQVGGTASFSQMFGLGSYPNAKYRLSAGARAIIEDTAFGASDQDDERLFELENGRCTVDFVNCGMRSLARSRPGFNHLNTMDCEVSSTVFPAVISNDGSQLFYKWSGGYVDAEGASLRVFGGSACVPSTDPDFGRKLVFLPTSSGLINAWISVGCRGSLQVGDQVVFSAKMRLPAFGSDQWVVAALVDGVSVRHRLYPTAFSGQVVDMMLAFKLETPAALLSISFSNGASAGALELYALAMYQGNSVPRRELPVFPRNIATFGPSAPVHHASGWNAGDVVRNSAPAAGQPRGWICVQSGSPGVWLSEGTL